MPLEWLWQNDWQLAERLTLNIALGQPLRVIFGQPLRAFPMPSETKAPS